MLKRMLLALTFALPATPANAAVYKWADEHGTTHYSANPPYGKKAQVLEEAPQPNSENALRMQQQLQQTQQHLEEFREKRKMELAEEDTARAQRAKDCDYLKSTIIQLGIPGPYSAPTKDGNAIVMFGESKKNFQEMIEKKFREQCR